MQAEANVHRYQALIDEVSILDPWLWDYTTILKFGMLFPSPCSSHPQPV